MLIEYQFSGVKMSVKNIFTRKWTLSYMVTSTAVLAAIVTSTGGFFALYEMDLMSKNTAELTEEWVPKISKVGEISTHIARFRTAEWEAIDDKTEEDKKKSEDRLDESSGNVTIYNKSFAKLITDEDTQRSFDKFSALWDKYIEEHDKFYAAAKAGKTAEATAILNGESQKIYTEMFDEMKNITDISYQGSVSAKESSDKISVRARWMVGALALASLLLSSILAWFIARFISRKIENVVNKLNEGSEILTGSIVEISSSSTNLSESVTEQVSALHETVASVSEISSKVEQNNQTADKTLQASVQSMKAAEDGMKNMNDVMDSINNISSGMQDLVGKIDNSHKEIGEIVTIISAISNKTKVINDIVFQTRLLSFNASVEAARAGENGKGFAVVAEEIGKLAQMSGDSANEIGVLLESSTSKVHEIVERAKEQTNKLVEKNKEQIKGGNTTATRCNDSLQEIKSNIILVNELITKIASASEEQAHGLKEISGAMNQLNDSTSYNSNIASVTSKEAQRLDQQAKDQTVLIDDLTKLIKNAA
jgi:methyl-accepting chemotaxis protein